jgi:hypothetical protein
MKNQIIDNISLLITMNKIKNDITDEIERFD